MRPDAQAMAAPPDFAANALAHVRIRFSRRTHLMRRVRDLPAKLAKRKRRLETVPSRAP